MKSTLKIICKISILFLFLYLTPFYSVFLDIFGNENLKDTLVYKQRSLDETISIKDQLNILSANSNFTLDQEDFEFETTAENPMPVPEPPKVSNKKVYIYNTHQSEDYAGGETVMDAGALLASELQTKGYTVVLETNDFKAYGNANGLDYNQSYAISYKFLNDALVDYGGFDLIVDLHRDAIPREASYLEADGKSYAKMMMVVGGLSSNVDAVTSRASTLNDIINGKLSGIMRTTMTREAYYNQQVHPNTILIELGGQINPFDEIKHSIPVLADGIAQYLG